MMNKIIIGICLLAAVIAGAALFRYQAVSQTLARTQTDLATYRFNAKTLNFLNVFIEKVLQSKGEIDFETRLLLENSVRELNDKEILAAWQQFVDSPSEAEAQTAVKNLLALLVKKVTVK